MLKNALFNLGLSDKEIKVYLALLETGAASAVEISKKTDINHSTVYVTLNRLMSKGLASQFQSKNTTKFVVENPDSLKNYLKEKRHEVDRQEEELNKYFPELRAIFNSSLEKPVVRLYEGKNGMKTLEKEADEIGSTVIPVFYSFTPIDIYYSAYPESTSALLRAHREQKLKLIYTHQDGVQNFSDPKLLREARFLPRDKFPFDNSIVIAPNHNCRIYSFKKGFFGILIDSSEIANSFKSIFDVCWRLAQKE